MPLYPQILQVIPKVISEGLNVKQIFALTFYKFGVDSLNIFHLEKENAIF